jgi:hypothetical protein
MVKFEIRNTLPIAMRSIAPAVDGRTDLLHLSLACDSFGASMRPDVLSDPSNKCGLWIKLRSGKAIERPQQSEAFFVDGSYYYRLVPREMGMSVARPRVSGRRRQGRGLYFQKSNKIVVIVAKITNSDHIALIDAAVRQIDPMWMVV